MGNDEMIKYLIVGGFNTVFGYLIGVIGFLLLQNKMHILFIAAISNILAISMSFLTYKTLVFKTKGDWIEEYLKCYMVYGSTALLGGLLIWIFVDYLSLNIWLAQAIVVLVTVCVSYFGHKKYTFKKTSSHSN